MYAPSDYLARYTPVSSAIIAYVIRREAGAVKRFTLTPAELRKVMHDRRIQFLAAVIETGDKPLSDYASAALWHSTPHRACVKQAKLLFAARLSQIIRDYDFARTVLIRASIHRMSKVGLVACNGPWRLGNTLSAQRFTHKEVEAI